MRSNNGSAIIATLALGFMLTVMTLSLAVVVNANYKLAGTTARTQRAHFGMEQMAERTMARILPEARWDGTFDRWALRDADNLQEVMSDPSCTWTYTPNVDQLDAGVIHVSMLEECAAQPPRRAQMAYRMSPDFRHIEAIGERAEELLPQGNPITSVSACNSIVSGALRTTVRINSREAGYVRLYLENSDDGAHSISSLLRERHLLTPGTPISPGSTVNATFNDPFPAHGNRRLNVLFSRNPIPEEGRVRGACPDGSCDAIAASDLTYPRDEGCTS